MNFKVQSWVVLSAQAWMIDGNGKESINLHAAHDNSDAQIGSGTTGDRHFQMKPDIKNKLDGVFSYPFFQSVGSPLPPSVTKIGKWPTAAKMCRSQKWEACQLMARNALARATERASWERDQEWNPLAEELRPSILTFVDSLLPTIPVSEKGRKNIRDAVSWDIMFICLEQQYRDLVEPLFYLPHLDPWYAAGHFPCGWDGDEFPDTWDGVIRGGQLMVF